MELRCRMVARTFFFSRRELYAWMERYMSGAGAGREERWHRVRKLGDGDTPLPPVLAKFLF